MVQTARIVSTLMIVGFIASPASACVYCKERPKVWAGVFDENFVSLLLQVTLAVPLLIAIGLAFHLADRWPLRMTDPQSGSAVAALPILRRGPLLSAGVTLGIGLGGFLDGIFLHMLLQWHNLIAERIAPTDFVTLEINMFWDGVFNLGMWLITAVGLGLLWRASHMADVIWAGKALVGAMLVGWGIFQLADSVLFHWVFHLHHIKQGSPHWLFWDLAYFVMGLVLIALGWLTVRSGQNNARGRLAG